MLVNLASVGESLWRKVPPSGVRTIESIALHVGGCKVMYDEYAFGRGALAWNDGQVQPWARGEAPMDDTVLWLKQAHERFRGHVRALNDSDLAELRQTNWGEPRETRWLISTVLQHDTYHAGEVNHIRSLVASDDGWKWG